MIFRTDLTILISSYKYANLFNFTILYLILISSNGAFEAPVIQYVCENSDAVYMPSANYCIRAMSNGDFYNAEIACLQLGGYLPSIRDPTANENLVNYIKDFFTCELVWIGMDVRNAWLDQTQANFSNFNDEVALPITRNSSNSCVYLNTTDGFWGRKECQAVLPYACTFPAKGADSTVSISSTTDFTTPTTVNRSRCFGSSSQNPQNAEIFDISSRKPHYFDADSHNFQCHVGSCKTWLIGGLILLRDNTVNPDQATQIELFKSMMKNAAGDCHSDSQMYVLTPLLAYVKSQMFPKPVTNNNENFIFDSLLNETTVTPLDRSPANATYTMLEYVGGWLQENKPINGQGSIVYFMTDFTCDNFCDDVILDNQQQLFDQLYNASAHIRLYYSGSDPTKQWDCMQQIFSNCKRLIEPDVCNFESLDQHSKKNVVESACQAEDNHIGSIIAIIISILGLCVLIVGIIARCYYKHTNGRFLFIDLFKCTPCYKKKKRKNIIGSLAASHHFMGNAGGENFYELTPGARSASEWEINPDNLLVIETKQLGSGAFAFVYEGILKGDIPLSKLIGHHVGISSESDGTHKVAVKRLPPYANAEAINDFRQEIAFMKQLGFHLHILSLLGCITESAQPMIITEVCQNGDILSYIRARKDNFIEDDSTYSFVGGIKLKDLISFAWQTADGMTYLSTKNIVHRDIAARNILLTEGMVAKIADFGLCRLVDQALYTSKGGRLPIKWMALESLKYYEYTLKSDVWSFGVMLFEFFSLGETPYSTVQPSDMPQHLEDGNRLPQPEKCPEGIYKMMQDCWKVEPNLRPKIEEIREDLSKLLTDAANTYGYLDVEAQVRTTSFVDEGEVCGIPADIFRQSSVMVEHGDNDTSNGQI